MNRPASTRTFFFKNQNVKQKPYVTFIHPFTNRSFKVQEGFHAILVALCAVSTGVVFALLGTGSIFFGIVGKMFIMGGFIIAITAFLLFLREWVLSGGE